jgi:hypothetical protein
MASERLYAFKLKFARHLVETRGRLSDYKRLRQVQEEAIANGFAFLLNHHSFEGGGASKLARFPSYRLGRFSRAKLASEADG